MRVAIVGLLSPTFHLLVYVILNHKVFENTKYVGFSSSRNSATFLTLPLAFASLIAIVLVFKELCGRCCKKSKTENDDDHSTELQHVS